MKIRIELDEQTIKGLVIRYLKEQLGDLPLDATCLDIQVKSKQNYKSEWEESAHRVVYEKFYP